MFKGEDMIWNRWDSREMRQRGSEGDISGVSEWKSNKRKKEMKNEWRIKIELQQQKNEQWVKYRMCAEFV